MVAGPAHQGRRPPDRRTDLRRDRGGRRLAERRRGRGFPHDQLDGAHAQPPARVRADGRCGGAAELSRTRKLELLRTQTLSALQLELTQPEAIADRAFRAADLRRSIPMAGARAPGERQGDHPGRPGRASSGPGSGPAARCWWWRGRDAGRSAARSRPGLSRDGPASPRRSRRSPGPAGPAPGPSSSWSTAPARSSPTSSWATSPIPPDRSPHLRRHGRQPGAGRRRSSRLFMILREEKSWTYGAYSGLRPAERHRLFFRRRTEVRTEVTDSALRSCWRQLAGSAPRRCRPRSSTRPRARSPGSFPLSIESADQVANAVANARLTASRRLCADLPGPARARSPRRRRRRSRAPTIRPDAAAIIVVGDGAKIYDKIKGIAPVTHRRSGGKAAHPGRPVAQGGALDLDLSALVPPAGQLRDAVFRAIELGWQRGVLDKTADGFRYTEDTQIRAAS